MPRPRLCLNTICKNEAGRIVRMLASVAPHISCYAIYDTGSSDGTTQLAKEFLDGVGIPGKIVHGEFKNFSQARNEGLRAARALDLPWDYVLLVDADMELIVKDRTWLDDLDDAPSHDMMQMAGSLHYMNRRLISRKSEALYRGVTHEYLDAAPGKAVPEEKAFFFDNADGANRPDKFKRDIALLLEGLKDEPTNERYFFYLAQSYRDGGMPKEAAEWYKRRVEAGGWDEEVWCAQLNLAACYKELGNEAEFIRNLLIAYNFRPSRAESLYDLAKHYREAGQNQLAALFAEAGMQIPRSKDGLFVNDYVYEVGLKEEFSIAAYYVPGKQSDGYRVTDFLSLKPGPYGGSRELARNNMFHYLPTLKDIAPSFKWHTLDFKPDEHWIAMNPSVTAHDGGLACVIRTVNYKINEWGGYLIRATDGTANDSNPINTRNFLVSLNLITLQPDPSVAPREIRAELPPPQFKAVIGFEDMRLFSWRGRMWTSSTVREMNPQGICEQVLARVAPKYVYDAATFEHNLDLVLADVKQMPYRGYEKNWTPLVRGDDLHFMYRPGEIVDTDCKTVQKEKINLDIGHFSGGSQMVRYNGGWLCLIHEARVKPGHTRRFYQHRFMYYDMDFKRAVCSLPFVFNDKDIEFAAGMALHPTTGMLVISYGWQDKEARIATVDPKEVVELWLPK